MRIVIVDDEELACRGISAMIRRAFGQREVDIHYFTNPVEALKALPELNPQILLLDMIMPELNGIEFISKADKSSSMKIVVISGSDEYSFIRECFKLNVKDYLLKPIEFSELKNLLLNLTSDFESTEKADSGNPSLPENHGWLFTAVVKASVLTAEFTDRVLMIPASHGMEQTVEVSVLEQKNGDTSFLFSMGNKECFDNCVRVFRQIFCELSRNSGTVIKAAYSQLFERERFDEAVSQMYGYFKSRIYDEKSGCYCCENNIPQYDDRQPEFYKRLNLLIPFLSYRDIDEYKAFIAECFDIYRLKKLSYSTVKKQYNSFVKKLVSEIMPTDESLEIREFDEFRTLLEILNEINRIVSVIYNYLLEIKQQDACALEDAHSYIKSEYDSEITLSIISNRYNLNYSYFSRVFKEYYGVSFTQYLLRVRMEKAKELLINSKDLKINDIAERVGYDRTNAQNFTRAFKNYYGKSPQYYRKNI